MCQVLSTVPIMKKIWFSKDENLRNNLRTIGCEVADGVLGKKVRKAARNISEKAICLKQKIIGLYKNYPSDRSYENKRNVKKLEKVLNMK